VLRSTGGTPAITGAKGLVIAGVGNGNLTQTADTALAAQAKKGIVCVRACVVTGVVGRNVELEDDRLGFVASLDKTPQKARVLRVALLKPRRAAADVQRSSANTDTALTQQLAASRHGSCLALWGFRCDRF
jgi:L-asparaginase/Glu-tRNA(Gln) amidotransferase subunit D